MFVDTVVGVAATLPLEADSAALGTASINFDLFFLKLLLTSLQLQLLLFKLVVNVTSLWQTRNCAIATLSWPLTLIVLHPI